MDKKLYGKVIFKGIIKAVTGLHIGASKETLEIGGLDMPVIKHPITGEPYIPGSSLKGKLRSLLEMKFHTEKGLKFNHEMRTGGNIIRIHVCNTFEEAKNCEVCRIFGSSGDTNFPARIKIRDAEFTEFSQEFTQGNMEIKFENSLDRITSASNPRQVERVPAGTEFEFEIIYNVEDLDHLEPDLNNLLSAMELLQDDTLGGHGSRGYGRIKFYLSEVIAKPVESYFGKAEDQVVFKSEWKSDKPVAPDKLKTLSEIKRELKNKFEQIKRSFGKTYTQGGGM